MILFKQETPNGFAFSDINFINVSTIDQYGWALKRLSFLITVSAIRELYLH
jgi:hypothetical protein